MPWSESGRMEQRAQFVLEVLQDVFSLSELCARYGVSRKTGYKWLARYGTGGVLALQDRSRAPRHVPHATARDLVEHIEAERRAHPTWGARKLRRRLQERHPELPWPAASTIGTLLRRAGLIAPRRRRAGRAARVWEGARSVADAPNRVWSLDFKGEFRLGNAQLCYPLTVLDQHSRYLLACHGLASTRGAEAQARLQATFAEYGLPEVIRTDNGAPFRSTGLQGLSRLAVWWIKLGIRLERGRPGRPQDHARHERMHRTLKAEGTRPPAATLAAQQVAFERFRAEYNQERPHEALGQATPGARYHASPRALPREVPEPVYPAWYERRRVSKVGTVKWCRRPFFLSEALRHEEVGFEPVEDGLWSIHFGPVLLGRWDEAARRFTAGAGF